jgi:Pectate lyase superfamily protein
MLRTARVASAGVVMGIVLGGLALAGPPAHSAGALAVFDVTDFGATGNGVTDDSPAFRAAIAAADTAAGTNTVFIPAGTYLMDTDGNELQGVLELTDVTNVDVVGEGASSLLKYKARNWFTEAEPHLFACRRCAFVSFSDLAIDGSKDEPGFVGADVQRQHGVQLRDSHHVTVQRLTLSDTWGDGVEVFGQPGITENVTIRDNVFLDNGRSGVGVQGGTRFVDILDNQFEGISDQSIDFEPTGSDGGRPAPSDFLIQGNTIVHSTIAKAVTLGGQALDNRAQRIQFLDNHLTDAAVRMRYADDVLVQGNTFTFGSVQPNSALSGAGLMHGTVVRDNAFVASNPGKAVIEFLADKQTDDFRTLPQDVTIELNEVHQLVPADGIVLDSVVGPAIVRDNEITGSGDGQGIKYRLTYDDDIVREDAEITGNIVDGFGVADIGLDSAVSGTFGDVTVCGNDLSNSPLGVGFFLQAATALEEALVCDNTFAPSVTTPVKSSHVTHFRGTGSPEGVIGSPVGSEFIRTDEANRLYLKQSGNNTTGWVGQ